MTAVREISHVREIVEEVRSGGGTVEQQLARLFDSFNTAVRVIDPSIKGSWTGYDANMPDRPAVIIFEREGAGYFKVPQ
ncbi:hypothetical protein [Mesorhizobium sp. CAU 1741]|uniref:hypothetical protein n=1 Tax=Mesorhizobium sp. CAU 1741 TaxID=3140366 RepID=UPI00325C0296